MWKRATIRLTIQYALLFLGFIWLFSSSLYFWINQSLGQNYVSKVENLVEQVNGAESPESREQAAQVAAKVAINRFKNVLIAVNGIALIIVPFGAYLITRRTLRPLIESQEQQKQFVANASHELRTPLAILSGELELALKKPRSAGYYHNTLTASKTEVERMVQLTNQLLLLNQIDNQLASRNLSFEQIDLAGMLRQVCKRYTTLATDKGLRISATSPFEMATTERYTLGNPRLVETALSNVIHNAVKYSPKNSHVPVTVSLVPMPDNYLQVTIKNNSKAMSKQEARRIFDRFYQSPLSRESSSSMPDGFGLGLAIAKSVMELHSGTITVEATSGTVRVSLRFKRT